MPKDFKTAQDKGNQTSVVVCSRGCRIFAPSFLQNFQPPSFLQNFQRILPLRTHAANLNAKAVQKQKQLSNSLSSLVLNMPL
ncbi:uncharacterized protein MYCGRDRAFT_83225, partial [Zymoseptoria tritici IPO323]